MKTMLGWHFSAANKRLCYGDCRLIRTGRTLKVDCDPVLCKSGLHASARLIDALGYAPGPYLWRVKLSGVIVRGDDKDVATERMALWGFDARDMLREFARKCALDAIHLWDAPEVVVRYLKTGDETIRSAAWSAAWSAARSAEWSAAAESAAAESAAWSAAWSAARSAAWSAAWSAAAESAAARSAAARSAAARSAAAAESAAAKSAARSAAARSAAAAESAAAKSAARSAQNSRLLRMVRKWRAS